ncbi:hypothetical protein [Nocardia fluminea]|uniref:hypothetical protein n=1 Tax=Nocardia fluminea TaxID=134984 RepID=UPI0033C21E67
MTATTPRSEVSRVLLAGGWHAVAPGTWTTDVCLFSHGRGDTFAFTDADTAEEIGGPMKSVLAVARAAQRRDPATRPAV